MNTAAAIGAAAVIGLIVGSFLTVVVHRLPRMLERRWAQEAAAYLSADGATRAIGASDGSAAGAAAGQAGDAGHRYDLWMPGSACPHCQHRLRWWENLPVVSWLLLRGRCHACGQSIGLRYPLVELATASLFALCMARWGFGPTALVWAGFSATVLALALIDWDTTWLPDDLTLPLVWAGVLASALGWTGTPLEASVWGAAGGYLFLWAVARGFRLVTGQHGMGDGDFKLLAALGAWFGAPMLLPLVLLSSAMGAVAGLAMKATIGLVDGKYVQFGPWLGAAAGIVLGIGPDRLARAVSGSLGL
jgi:leader peptidase (prepilin peptidase)/N-methyltransferase